jgi:hypothetical protein
MRLKTCFLIHDANGAFSDRLGQIPMIKAGAISIGGLNTRSLNVLANFAAS